MKRLLALLLCAVMLFSVLGAEVFAAESDTLTVYSKSGGRRQIQVGDTVTYTYSLRILGIYKLDRIWLDVLFDDECLEFVSAEYPSFSSDNAADTVKNGDFRMERGFIPNGDAFSQSICDIVRITFKATRAGTTHIRTLADRIELEGSKESDRYAIENYRPNAVLNSLIATYDYLGENRPNNSSSRLNNSQDVVWFYVQERDTAKRLGTGHEFILRGADEDGRVQEFRAKTDRFGYLCFGKVPFGSYVLTTASGLVDGSSYVVVDPNVDIPMVRSGKLNIRRTLEVRRLYADELRDVRVNTAWTEEYIEPGVKYTGERPESVYLALEANGTVYGSVYLTPSEKGYTFARMPIADENGNELNYDLIPGVVPHYESSVTPTEGGFDLVFRYLNDHDWEVVRTEPTCEDNGRAVYTCSDCGRVYTYVLSPLGHDYAISGYDATCEKDGYHLYVCKRCNKWYVETPKATGHDWGEWITDKAATENTDGKRHRFCNLCGEREDGVIACPLHEHTYTTVVVEPTCTKGGYTMKRCGCGDSFIVEGSRTEALGHDYTGNTATRTVIENSCTEDGLKEYKCARCGEMHAESLPAHGHNYGVTDKHDADCTHSGYTTYECSYCGDKRTERVAALGHDWGDWIIDQPATATAPGSKHRVCARCLVEEVASIPTVGAQHKHHYDDVQVVEPSCTEQGYTQYICPDDGASFIDEETYTPALGHDWVEDWRTESTTRTRGMICFKCTRCGELRFESMPRKDGSWTNPFWDVKESDWFYDAVRYVAYNEYMKGTSSSRFEPNGSMTRAMLVTVLYRMVGEPDVKDLSMPFTDVPEGWFHDAVLWAYDTGVVNGVSPEEFAPNRLITREQMVTIFWRYANYAGYDTSETASLAAFPDAGSVSAYAKDAFAWAVEAKIIGGVGVSGGKTELQPQGTATRAQAAAIIQRFDRWRLD